MCEVTDSHSRRAFGVHSTTNNMADLHINLPSCSPYQCGRDFRLFNEGGFIVWQGLNEAYADCCGEIGFRAVHAEAIKQAAADAVFHLAQADGLAQYEAVIKCYGLGLPIEPLAYYFD